MRKFLLLIAALTVMLIPQAAFAQDDQNCADFTSQAAAQSHFNANRSDPDGLDRDNDGKACEDWPGPWAKSAPSPTQGKTLPFTGSHSSYLLISGMALLGLGAFLVRRNRTA